MALAKIKIQGKEYEPEDLELDDVEWIEDHLGKDFSEINFASAKGLKAFVYVVVRRDNPDYTLEDAGKLKLGELIQDVESENGGGPLDAEAGAEG